MNTPDDYAAALIALGAIKTFFESAGARRDCVHRRAFRRGAFAGENQRDCVVVAARRHRRAGLCRARRETAGIDRSGHHCGWQQSRPRLRLQRQRSKLRSRADGDRELGRQDFYFVRRRRRLTMYGFHGRLLHIDLTNEKVHGRISTSRACAVISAASDWARACSMNMRLRGSIPLLPPIR